MHCQVERLADIPRATSPRSRHPAEHAAATPRSTSPRNRHPEPRQAGRRIFPTAGIHPRACAVKVRQSPPRGDVTLSAAKGLSRGGDWSLERCFAALSMTVAGGEILRNSPPAVLAHASAKHRAAPHHGVVIVSPASGTKDLSNSRHPFEHREGSFQCPALLCLIAPNDSSPRSE